MKSQILANFTSVYLPAIGFVLFFLIFIGAVIWVYRPRSKEFYKELSRLALEDEHNER